MNIHEIIQSQYLAALAMLRQAVSQCPDALWTDARYKNVFWNVTYHALFYTHLYLQPDGKDFSPWAKHREGYHEMKPQYTPYPQAEVLEYLDFCREQVQQIVGGLDLHGPSGFGWLPFSKLELQFYNIRHLQQHTGELSERLGGSSDNDINWVSQG